MFHFFLRNFPQPRPALWMSRFLPPQFFVGTLWNDLSYSLTFCWSLWKRIPTSYLPRIRIHIGDDRNVIKERPRASLHSWSAVPMETPDSQLANSKMKQLRYWSSHFLWFSNPKGIPLFFRYEFSHLYSFSKPHFISKNATMAPFETTLHPRNAIQLVLA